MQITPNLSLKKPDGSDVVDIAVLNSNADTLDAAVAAKAPLASPAFTGTVSAAALTVNGALTSTVASGTAPLTVASSTRVVNLNADKLDGYDASTTAASNTIPVYNASAQLVGDITGNAASAARLSAARTLSLTGDATASLSFDGSTNASGALTLGASGVSAGTYKSVTVDAKGRVTSGTNPTTLSGYGITDAAPSSHVSDLTSHVPYAAATGSANTYAVTLSPAPSTLTAGLALAVQISTVNTGASTINVNGLGAKSILTSKGASLTSGKLVSGGIYTLRYNGTAFILQGEGGEYGTAVAGDVLAGKTIGTDNGIVTGTMTNNGAWMITPSTNIQTIPAGYHNGNGKVAAGRAIGDGVYAFTTSFPYTDVLQSFSTSSTYQYIIMAESANYFAVIMNGGATFGSIRLFQRSNKNSLWTVNMVSGFSYGLAAYGGFSIDESSGYLYVGILESSGVEVYRYNLLTGARGSSLYIWNNTNSRPSYIECGGGVAIACDTDNDAILINLSTWSIIASTTGLGSPTEKVTFYNGYFYKPYGTKIVKYSPTSLTPVDTIQLKAADGTTNIAGNFTKMIINVATGDVFVSYTGALTACHSLTTGILKWSLPSLTLANTAPTGEVFAYDNLTTGTIKALNLYSSDGVSVLATYNYFLTIAFSRGYDTINNGLIFTAVQGHVGTASDAHYSAIGTLGIKVPVK